LELQNRTDLDLTELNLSFECYHKLSFTYVLSVIAMYISMLNKAKCVPSNVESTFYTMLSDL